MTKEYNAPDIGTIDHPFAKPCMMTIFMHDYAYPPSIKIPGLIPFVYTEGKPQPPKAIQIYSVYTMEVVRYLSDEMLGKLVRETLNKLEEGKKKIEHPRP